MQCTKSGVLEKANELKEILKKDFRVDVDIRDQVTPGYKFNECELKGIPVRIEIGPRDIENGECILVRRDTYEKKTVKLQNINAEIKDLLEDIQKNMFKMCEARLKEKTQIAKTLDEFVTKINEKQGYIKAMWCGDIACEDRIKDKTRSTFKMYTFYRRAYF